MHDTNSLWTRARAMFARAAAMFGPAGDGDAALSFVAHIASLVCLPPGLRRQIIAWLAPLEHVVRKLLLAEAAALQRAERANANSVRVELVPLRGVAQHAQAQRPSSQREEDREEGRTTGRAISSLSTTPRPLPLPPPRGAGAALSTCVARSIDLARPETWRARFSFALPRPHYVSNANAPRIRALWGGDTHAHIRGPERADTPGAPVRHSFAFRLARRFEALRRVLENPHPHAERLAHALAREAPRLDTIVQRAILAPCRTNDYDRDDPLLGVDAMGLAYKTFSDSS